MSPPTEIELQDAAAAACVRWNNNLARWVIGAVAAGASVPLLGVHVVALWLGCWFAAQVAEYWIIRPVARGSAAMTAGRLHAATAALFTSGAIFAGLSVPYWMMLGERGGAVAALIVVGGLLNALVICNTSRRLFLALLIPSILALVAQPVLALGLSGDLELLAPGLAGAGSVIVAALMVWRQIEHTRRAERHARAELETAVARSEAAVAAKSAFVAMVSHELRTPISGVLAASGELERSDDPRTAEHARMIGDSGRLMRVVLNDLLDVAKIEAGRMSVEATAFDIRELVDGACRFWAVEAADKGLGLGVRGVGALPRWVQGDPTRLRQILNNLLSNAVKFTDTGAVTLSAQSGDDDQGRPVIRIAISDTGPGISREAQETLFTPYAQGEASTARLHGGTGLGLTISRRLARLMEGELTVESRIGSGSTFNLRLPLRLANPGVTPVAEVVDPMHAPEGLKVLVADDHGINRRAVRLLLSPLSPDLVEAASGQEALDALAVQVFDLVLMDVRMPGIDGLEAVRRLRAVAGPNRHTPVLAITASTAAEDVAACLAAGMDGFVAKPLDARDLLAAVSEAATTPAYRSPAQSHAEAA